MKFMSGFFGKLLLVILCILLGVVLTLGGIAGAGYYVLMTNGMMGTIEEKANESGAVKLEFSDEVKNMSVFTWAKGFLDVASKLTAPDGPTIGDLEKYIGMEVISTNLSEILNMDKSIIQGATLVGEETGLGATITANMTVSNVLDLIGGASLPDMPIFKSDSSFMNEPIKTAFGSLTDFTLGDFIEITDGSAKVMRSLKNVKVSEIGDTIPTMPIGDFIDQGDDTHPVIKAISPLSINDLGTSRLTDTINGMKLSDILSGMTEDDTNKVLYSLRELTVGDLSGQKADKLVNSMFLGEIMDIDDSSNQALQTLKYSCISSQYVELSSAIHDSEGKYAYVPGEKYSYVVANTDSSYYVAYYPETIEYDRAFDDNGVAVYKNGMYGIVYRLYRPTAALTDGKVTIHGVEFSAVLDEENNPVTKDDDTLVETVLYVESKTTPTDTSYPVTVKNRYHCLFDESGRFVFRNCFDEALKGVLLIPDVCVESTDATAMTLSSYSQHKIVDGRYLDSKAVSSDRKVNVDGAEVTLYEFHPLEGINETMNDVTLGGVLTIDETSPKIMKSLKDTKITEMGSAIDNLPLGDMIDVGDSRILRSLADTSLNGMAEKVDTLYIDELMEINDDSSRMIKVLRYSSLKSSTEYIDLGELINSDSAAFAAVTDAAEYKAMEDEYYSNYLKQGASSPINRYYYRVEGNAVTGVYVLYLDDSDVEKADGEGKTLFFKTRVYSGEKAEYIDLTDSTTYKTRGDAGIDINDEDNLAILNAEITGKHYYYTVDSEGKITDVYVQSGTPVTTGAGTLVAHIFSFYRPMIGLSDKTNELILSDVLEITPSSSKIMRNLADTKINKMGQRIDEMTLGEMVNTSSSKLLTALADARLDDIGERVNTIFIDEMIGIDDDSSQMIKSLRYAALESRLVYLDKTSLSPSATVVADNAAEVKALEVSDYSNYGLGNRYYYEVENNNVKNVYVLYLDGNDAEKTQGTNTAFYKTKLYEQREYSYIDLTSLTPSSGVVRGIGENNAILDAEESDKTYYYRIGSGSLIEQAYVVVFDDNGEIKTDPGDPTLSEVYTVTGRHNRPMIGLSDKTNELVLGDVFSAENLNSGVLSLIDENTKLNNISDAVATAVQNSSVAILSDTGVIDSATFGGEDFNKLSKERKCFIYNSTMTDMLNGMIGFIANPLTYTPAPTINYSKVSPHKTTISASSYASLTDFVAAYTQYDELEFSAATTVTVDATADAQFARDINGDSVIDYYAIPVFNVTGSGVTFSGASVYLAVYDADGSNYTYGAHQVGYYYDAANCGIAAEAQSLKLIKVTDPTP